MPKRLISSDMWSDAFFEELSCKAKLLFIYLVTNAHTSQAGIGQVTDKKVAAETDIDRSEVPNLFAELAEQVERLQEWYWVRNFVRHQVGNRSFFKAAARYSERTPFNTAFKKYYENNDFSVAQHSTAQEVSPPCRQALDTLSTPCRHPVASATIHNSLLKALDKINISPEEIEIAGQLITLGCDYQDIEAARKLKNKNNLKYLQNIVCEMRDIRKGAENLDEIPY